MSRAILQAALILTATCSVLLAGSEAAFSQQRGPRRYRGVANEPYVSPYLNLVRPGADAGFNYYTLVQPQMQQSQFNQQQTQSMQGFDRRLQQQQAEIMSPYGPVGGIRPTGRGATFMNYSHYYPGLGGASGGGRSYSSSLGGGGMSMGGMGGGY